METVSSVNTGETSESASAFKSSIADEDKDNKSVISLQEGEIRNTDGELLAEELPGDSYVKFSRQSWENDDVKELARQLVARGFKEERVDKWIHDVNGIAKMIADNRDTLDYEASPYFTMLKNNQEYVKTLDASTLCPKQLLYQGIYNEIQHMLQKNGDSSRVQGGNKAMEKSKLRDFAVPEPLIDIPYYIGFPCASFPVFRTVIRFGTNFTEQPEKRKDNYLQVQNIKIIV